MKILATPLILCISYMPANAAHTVTLETSRDTSMLFFIPDLVLGGEEYIGSSAANQQAAWFWFDTSTIPVNAVVTDVIWEMVNAFQFEPQLVAPEGHMVYTVGGSWDEASAPQDVAGFVNMPVSNFSLTTELEIIRVTGAGLVQTVQNMVSGSATNNGLGFEFGNQPFLDWPDTYYDGALILDRTTGNGSTLTITYTVVPEPKIWLLAPFSLLGFRRRR